MSLLCHGRQPEAKEAGDVSGRSAINAEIRW
jgi:hypothetical protein